MSVLPKEFTAQMQAQLGSEWPDFVEALSTPGPVSVHFNSYKDQSKAKLPIKSSVPWNPGGMYLSERPSFTLDPAFHAGRYYVQEAGSMFLAHILKEIQAKHSIQSALDLCAAPGGKTTLLLNHLPKDCTIVANEVIKSRYNILRENLAKWGRSNIITTQADSKQFAGLNASFDLLLIDAPCSGEGLFRKTPEASGEWSLDNVQLCEARQRRILGNSLSLLHQDGILIYSTCTYNKKENDQNIRWLIEQGDLDLFPIEVPEEWNIYQTDYGYQFYPHRTQSEGFYLSVLVKKSGPSPKNHKSKLRYFEQASKKEKSTVEPWIEGPKAYQILKSPRQELFLLSSHSLFYLQALSQQLPRMQPGTPIGMIKGKDLVPAHELALANALSPQIPQLELNKEHALAFLRKADFPLPEKATRAWNLITFEGFGLGWVKVLPNRINNYFPKHLRIRMTSPS